MLTIKFRSAAAFCAVLHFQFVSGSRFEREEGEGKFFGRVWVVFRFGTNFHAKHPLAESKLKGAKVSVTIAHNQTLSVRRARYQI